MTALSLAAFWDLLPIGKPVFDLPPRLRSSRTRGGSLLQSFDGAMFWTGSAELVPLTHADSLQLEGLLRLLRMRGTFLAYDVRQPYPAFDPGGAFLAAGSLIAVGGIAASGSLSTGVYTVDGVSTTLGSALAVDSDAGTYFNVSGTLVTASADALRIDYDPVTHAVRGVLAETGFTNFVFPSNTFTGWSTNVSPSFAMSGTGPDGNACPRVTYDASSASSGYFKTLGAVTAGVTYRWSCWVKHNSGASPRFRFGCSSSLFGTGTQGATIDINPQTGAIVGGPAAGVSSYAIEDQGNGWYKVTVTAICATSSASHALVAYHGVAAAGANDIFGLQGETGSVAHSYVATTSGTVARAADALTFQAVGTNDWTLTFDDGSTQSFAGIAGDFSPAASALNRPRIKSWSAVRVSQPSASAPEIASVGSDNVSLALKKLPPFFEISVGDYLSFRRTGSKIALHQAVVAATADVTGTTPEFAVVPPLRTGTAVNDDVTLVKACGEFRMPGGFSPPSASGPISDGIGFSFEEVL